MNDNRLLSSVADDDAVYDNYIETTTDPGNSLLILALFICTGSVVVLPLSAKIGKLIARWNYGLSLIHI